MLTLWFKPIKIFVEFVGVIMGIQVPLMVIDRRSVSIMSARSRTRRVTHLRFDDARVALGYFIMVSPKVVRSLGWDPRHHEELRNGPEIKFHIKESGFWVTGKVRDFSVMYWKVLEGSRGSHGGAHHPERPTWGNLAAKLLPCEALGLGSFLGKP